jgi:hypothetical protein
MKGKTSPWFKVFALCTAVGFGGIYVWKQQQKATPQIEKTVERTVLSGSKSKVIAPTLLPVDQEEADRVLMPGSKSGVFQPNQEVPKQRAVMPGSKSFVVVPSTSPVDEKKTNLPATQQEPEVKERVLMPSSKSARVLPTTEIPVTPKQRTLLPGSKSPGSILESPKTQEP